MRTFLGKIKHAFLDALPSARRTAWWIIKIMIPLSLAVGILQYFHLLDSFSELVSPAFKLIGLSGNASIAFVSGVLVGCYGPIAIISSLNLDMREIIILGSMCVISHNLIIECAVQKKAGSSFTITFIVRIFMSFVSAIMLNYLLPGKESFAHAHYTEIYKIPTTFTEFLLSWGEKNFKLVIRIFCIIFSLLFLRNILKEFKIIDYLTKIMAPIMKLMGMSSNTSFLWVIGQTVGLAYGSGILIDELSKGEINQSEATRLNYHLAINHSQLEDPMLFVAIGAPFFWVSLPRYILSVVLVWIIVGLERIRRKRLEVRD